RTGPGFFAKVNRCQADRHHGENEHRVWKSEVFEPKQCRMNRNDAGERDNPPTPVPQPFRGEAAGREYRYQAEQVLEYGDKRQKGYPETNGGAVDELWQESSSTAPPFVSGYPFCRLSPY